MKKKLMAFISFILLFSSIMATLPLSTKAQEDVIKLGVLQFVEHDALDATFKGFKETMDASSYKDKIQWDVQNASGDTANLQSFSERLARDNDILFAIATPAAQSLALIESTKPIFFAAVTDPVEAGLAKSMEKPEMNLTGTSDMAPIDEQVELLVRNFPEIETVGILYNSSEVNSVIQAEMATKALEEKGLKVEEQTVTSTNDIHQAMSALARKVEGMFMVTDNTIDSAIQLVGEVALENNLPMIGSSKEVIEKGGLATISSSYEDYGRQTAEMVIRMLDEDLDVKEMSVELAKHFDVIVNKDFAEQLGIDPESIK
ncbi:ABC transporter substrate-binding protein [Dolosicoccus paucivorans]|uniref:ABC transporter substrate-binding protein n=1 Tax=Dolosicoccus paucivorans TaxID=84521 RepID=A0A1G8INC4_9LACT|nr:ABC transporter substrate-binding protein [Dolosicoccus paucivorans]PMB84348.1 ABC transporter substrate-binding protein [Dolosicoccus paucivorans]PMC58097.1 ABC transporter substrate-binding protein [Dolosicoccus paucivorans]SDI20548.1 putative ABC transport system substrate-binding protein [Dolosicoccus paucivorans]